jgi:hypothetical protein
VGGAVRGFSLGDEVRTGGVEVCNDFSARVEDETGTELVGLFSVVTVGLADGLPV